MLDAQADYRTKGYYGRLEQRADAEISKDIYDFNFRFR